MTLLDQAIKWSQRLLSKTYDTNQIKYTPLPGDAGFRCYIKIDVPDTNYMLVYSPPKSEKNDVFVAINKTWRKNQISLPHIYHYNEDKGFMLLSYLGDKRLIDYTHNINYSNFYHQAIDELIKIQSVRYLENLPVYNQNLLQQEQDLFTQWFIEKYLCLDLSPKEKQVIARLNKLLIDSAVKQPQVCVHRDYHSKNIIFNQDNKIGIVDYQDAVIGPITYDIVSLLKDCYCKFSATDIKLWLKYYCAQALHAKIIPAIDVATLQEWFNLMGMQRHLKAIGIFCRLHLRDEKSNYLTFIPQTLTYLKQGASQYAQCNDFIQLLNTKILPAYELKN